MYEGVTVTIGEVDYIVPPLNFRKLRALRPKLDLLKTLSADLSEGQIAVMVECVHAAMTRNYPDLTIAEVEELLDLGNMARIFKAVMNASGMEQRLGEAEPGTGTS